MCMFIISFASDQQLLHKPKKVQMETKSVFCDFFFALFVDSFVVRLFSFTSVLLQILIQHCNIMKCFFCKELLTIKNFRVLSMEERH